LLPAVREGLYLANKHTQKFLPRRV